METFPRQSNWQSIKMDLAYRVRTVREELYGEHGGPLLAQEIGVPFRTWMNYEDGCTIPGKRSCDSSRSPTPIPTGC